jgi:hypothetical protein
VDKLGFSTIAYQPSKDVSIRVYSGSRKKFYNRQTFIELQLLMTAQVTYYLLNLSSNSPTVMEDWVRVLELKDSVILTLASPSLGTTVIDPSQSEKKRWMLPALFASLTWYRRSVLRRVLSLDSSQT